MASLTAAFESGFGDLKLVESDEDLVNLRSDSRFAKLLAEHKKKVQEAAKRRLEKEFAKFVSFPFTFELPDLADKVVKLADFEGKVLIVDFWGTWCPPCRAEIPHFIKLKKTYNKKGLEIIGINFERVPKDQWKTVIQQFSKQFNMNYPSLIGDDATRRDIKLRAVPTTLFIDRTGKVRMKFEGARSYEVLEAVALKLLDEPVAEPKPGDGKKKSPKKASAKAEAKSANKGDAKK